MFLEMPMRELQLQTIIEEKENNNDAEEGHVWTPDLEQAFHEALALYPDGRRKIKYEGRIYGKLWEYDWNGLDSQ